MSVKYDNGKIDMSLLEFLPRALTEVCRVMTYGVHKYERGGFLDVPDGIQRYTAAMLRHYMAEQIDGVFDLTDPWLDTPEGQEFLSTYGNLRHSAQVAVNALFRLEMELRFESSMEAGRSSLMKYNV